MQRWKVKRLVFTRYPELAVEQAGNEGYKLLGYIAFGGHPTAEKKQKALQVTTLQYVFDDFLTARKNLEPLRL